MGLGGVWAGLAAHTEAALTRAWWQPRPTPLARLLWPLAALYGGLSWAARAIASRPQQLPVPVLVVGNLVVGGAGKTPAVMALVQAFKAAGRHPGVVSRGHGRSGDAVRAVRAGDAATEVGDEPLLVQRRTGVPVWVGRDRAAAVRALCKSHPEIDLVLSDDGLQHPRLRRDAELLVFDDRGSGNGLLLPAGPLRQALPRALGSRQRLLYSGNRISTPLPGLVGKRRLRLAWPLAAWQDGVPSGVRPLAELRDRPLVAMAGLADPEKFFAMLDQAGLLFRRLALPDHHDYARAPWPADARDVLTTEKDAVKLGPLSAGLPRIWVLPLDFQLPAGLADDLLTLLPISPSDTHLP